MKNQKLYRKYYKFLRTNFIVVTATYSLIKLNNDQFIIKKKENIPLFAVCALYKKQKIKCNKMLKNLF